ncbi:type VI secretion system baseplate subunit TssG [Sandaracinobacteroides saxicola]|uniref:Type VI secretion system baseplate subunit TssG n=1 Tax=Sandaracinobacteroides saxicola TaxID=2759707 RepID=A0A7G5IJ11_9SPHN|nr:type VI secretion system baseplate subunit TssG [Sandaracinobacteroides saxicola]QMW23353.1 type VI secretion system baseplate subunit TssG [Sandaracinobacteroides saxicola]
MGGPATDDLSALFEALAADPTRWDFFAVGRGVDAAQPDRPRIGEALDPAQEALDLEHYPSFNFPRTTLAEYREAGERAGRRPGIRSQHLGMTGPMGPLPSHLTEIAIYERGRRGPTPFADFLDMISARALQGFYRAWADSTPCANADRPLDDRFAGYVGAASGVTGLDFLDPRSRAAPSADAAAFDDWRRLPYAGLLASLRSPDAVARTLTHLLGRPVQVREAIGRWRPVPDGQRTRIGRAHAGLGQGATLGRQFYAVEFDVGLRIRARSMAELNDLLPGGSAHRLLSEAARSVLPHHVDWRAQVAIDEAAVEPARLGRAQLGWTGWMAPRGNVQGGAPSGATRLREDLVLRERPVAPAHQTEEMA